jgi:2-polyprenyl-3-methyl-5-hydroxy-6-metoxy-1,4-benzoquinol methylase
MPSKNYPEMQWTPEMVSRFWDWQSGTPEVYFSYRFGAEIAGSLAPYLNGRDRVLDYGCGVGYLLPHLCRHARAVYGADLSHKSVEQANARLSGTGSFEGAFLVTDLRGSEAVFDAIVAIEIIEHLYDTELDAMLNDIRAMLAAGGIVIFTTPNDEDRQANMILCPATGELFHRWQHVRSWNVETLPSYLRASGFTVLETFETNLINPSSWVPYSVLKRIVKRLLLGNPGKPHLVCVATARPGDAV